MKEDQYDSMLTTFLRSWGSEDTELWLVIENVSKALDIDYRNEMTLAQGEALWAGISGLVTKMLQYGYVVFYFADQGTRVPWPEQAPEQVLNRIKKECIDKQGKFPDVGFIAWFHNVKDNKR